MLNVAIEYLPDFIDEFAVILLADSPLAAAETILDVILQADAVTALAHGFIGDCVVTGANGIDFAQQLEHGACHLHIGIGTVEFAAAIGGLAREEHSRIKLLSDTNPGI